MHTIALYNLKGGVGKTATCVNLAWLAARDGYRTLLWDLDPQGSASFYFQSKRSPKAGIRNLLTQGAELTASVRATDHENLDLIPADLSARSLDVILEEMRNAKKKLRNLLHTFDGTYDFIFLDCPPGLSSFAENIFHAADIVLMPVIPTTLSIRTYDMVKAFFKEKEIEKSKMMCFFSMVDLRKNMHNQIMEELYRDKRFFENYIPYLSDVEKMGVHQAPIATFARSSYAARCYADLWEEIKEGLL